MMVEWEMELVRTILRLQLSEAFNSWVEMRSIIREVGENPSAEIQGGPIVIDLKDRKQRIALQIKAIELEQEGVDSIEDSIAVALDKVAKVNNVSKFPEVNQVWHEAIFIEPYALPFHELLILIKNRFLQVSELVDAATDIGLTFDQVEGDIIKHFQVGPMAKEQLMSMFLNWPKDDLPDNFLFMILKFEQRKAFMFESEYLKKFLEDANEWESSQAQLISSHLKQGGD